MDIGKRLNLIKEVGEEIVTEAELKTLLETKKHPIAYDGFEPSGTDIHIAQGLLRAINVTKMIDAGFKFIMLIADWHAWANNKMDGDLEKIQKVGEYYVEVWKACGMDTKSVEFKKASELLADTEYWKLVMQIARHSTLKRILRTAQIMGRSESDKLQASQILYPCMQAADIFMLKANVTQLGMDQRKVNMLAREIGPELGFWKPVVVSHHMLSSLLGPETVETETQDIQSGEEKEILDNYYLELKEVDDPSRRKLKVRGIRFNFQEMIDNFYGSVSEDERIATVFLKDSKSQVLQKLPLIVGKSITADIGISIKCLNIDTSDVDKITVRISPGKLQLTAAVKMSKSKPETAIFMNDTEETIKEKINKAYCPAGVVENNPILEYCKYIIFAKLGTIKIERPQKWGGNIELKNYQELENSFVNEKLHPTDLKRATAVSLNEILEPIRTKLAKNAKAQKLLKEIKTFKVTR